MPDIIRRVACIAVSVAAAAGSLALGLLAGEALFEIISPVSDAPKMPFFLPLAWPAYVFAKWSIEAWRGGCRPVATANAQP